MRLLSIFLLLLPCLALADDASEKKRFAECREKLLKTQGLGALYDVDWKIRQEPKVVVGRNFDDLPFPAKQALVDTLNCFFMGGADKYINFDLRDWRTNKVIGRYSYGKLKLE